MPKTELSRLSRRDFLKLGAAAASAFAVGQFIPPPVARAARQSGALDDNGSGYISTMCEMCVWRCGVRAKVVEGKVVKLEGNPEHPHSHGRLCARGQSGLMNTYDPDRVLTPLIRVGKRGEGKFRQATWSEALDEVAENMLKIKNTYGPEAMVFSSTHNLSQPLFENLLYGFGSPNYGTQRSLCFNAMVTAFLLTYGIEEPARNYDNVQYILLVGRNLTEAISTSETTEMIDAMARGAKLVYLDPRFTKTASKASEWIPVRPGTDLAFLLAMINIISTEQLGNCEFVKEFTLGCDQLPTHTAEYTPEWAESKCGIPADTIRRIAHEFAAAKPNALAHPGWRTSNFCSPLGTLSARAVEQGRVEDAETVYAEDLGDDPSIPLCPGTPGTSGACTTTTSASFAWEARASWIVEQQLDVALGGVDVPINSSCFAARRTNGGRPIEVS